MNCGNRLFEPTIFYNLYTKFNSYTPVGLTKDTKSEIETSLFNATKICSYITKKTKQTPAVMLLELFSRENFLMGHLSKNLSR